MFKPSKTDVSYLIMEMTKVTDRLDSLETNSVYESNLEPRRTEPSNVIYAPAHNFQFTSEIRKMKSNFDMLKTEMNTKIDRLVVS